MAEESKTCRYGHGALARVEKTWAIPAAVFPKSPSEPIQNITPLIDTNLVYTVIIFQCARCGYIELFDSDLA